MIREFCTDCKGDCCRQPWMSLDEYRRMFVALGNDRAMAAGPVFILGGWQFTSKICPALSDTGCIMSYADRPEACRIYPFVRIPTTAGSRLFLDVSRCKHWPEFGLMYDDAKMEAGIQ